MKIRLITPLHIGDGGEILPPEYSPEKGKLKVFPVDHIVSELGKIYSGPRLKNIYIQLRDFVKENGFKKNFGDFMREASVSIPQAYDLELRCALRYGDEYRPVKTFIKTFGKPYIPGSEIKGALRTAFIFGVILRELKNKENRVLNFVINEIKKALNRKNHKDKWKEAHENIENFVFRAGSKDAKHDIFKAVEVGDTKPADTNTLFVDSVKVVGTRRNISEPCELMREGTELEFRFSVNEEKKKALKKFVKNPYLDLVTEEFLRESSREFYKFLIDQEKEYFENLRENTTLEDLSKVSDVISNGGFPLRIGRFQGFLSLTLGIAVKLSKKELFKEMWREIFRRSDPNKTRRVTQDGRLLGWCQIE